MSREELAALLCIARKEVAEVEEMFGSLEETGLTHGETLLLVLLIAERSGYAARLNKAIATVQQAGGLAPARVLQ